jgi:toxin ParE1/3/4
MKYVFHPDALAEYAEAVKYYANQNREIAQAFINFSRMGLSDLMNS